MVRPHDARTMAPLPGVAGLPLRLLNPAPVIDHRRRFASLALASLALIVDVQEPINNQPLKG
jgi:hypothetical protein